jgi:leader peptidase (prepilin peptidase) / N-methyltransferase
MEAFMIIATYATGLLMGSLLILVATRMVDRRIAQRTTATTPVDSSGSTDAAAIAPNSIPAGFFTAQNILLANVNAGLWVVVLLKNGITLQSAFILAAISFAVIISSADMRIRRIPNSLVVVLILLGGLAISLNVFGESMMSHFIGLLVGTVIFAVPYLIGSSIGAGDVKYTGAIGFFLGYPGILYAAIALSAVLIVWIAVMFMARRNVMKKSIALGPFISVAFAATLLLYI